jgi:hypothetical protein
MWIAAEQTAVAVSFWIEKQTHLLFVNKSKTCHQLMKLALNLARKQFIFGVFANPQDPEIKMHNITC